MKVVLFAGGLGTRLMEETEARPKPMVEIGGKPIIWHIMKIYAHYGFNDFIICLGYKGHMIKEYFINYYMYNTDVTVDIGNNEIEIHQTKSENFKVALIDTGVHTKTAGRLKRVQHHLGNETFMLTYGDGVSNINIKNLLKFHQQHKRLATITSIQPAGRFGSLDIDSEGNVESFVEKPKGDGAWINGGFFVLEPDIFKYIPELADEVMWEEDPLRDLGKNGQLAAYQFKGFWKCMDHLRDKMELDQLIKDDKAPWIVW